MTKSNQSTYFKSKSTLINLIINQLQPICSISYKVNYKKYNQIHSSQSHIKLIQLTSNQIKINQPINKSKSITTD